ncbi:putative Heat shock protein 70 family [Rosa chinensis]|uniref:Putative Heat shock protein 70 family n=1 Tax=Rosa chinensis TaxID=74649 RepID=A0A2P6RXZ2_ROSCH|nr:luminal-binding protein 3 [Rosa chinensis]PRQ51274.1 putative Heat shock protein 70 family [Rosa chinensis]
MAILLFFILVTGASSGMAFTGGNNAAMFMKMPETAEGQAAQDASTIAEHIEEKDILVYNLGGGALDVSIVHIDKGLFEVMATSGDIHLGGRIFDDRLVDFFITLIKRKYYHDIRKNNKAVAKLRKDCERAKGALSRQHQTHVEVESLVDGIDYFSEPLTRAKFEELNMELFNKTIGTVTNCLEDAGLTKTDIDEIVLVGGSTRIPKVQQLLKDFFNGKEPNKGVNPDEAIAFGAAVLGGACSGDSWNETKGLILRDIVPFTLGMDIGDRVHECIPRNTVIPNKMSTKLFLRTKDNTAPVVAYECEGRLLPNECSEIKRIPVRFDKATRIEVFFDIDANGILHVTIEEDVKARDKVLARLSLEDVADVANTIKGIMYPSNLDKRRKLHSTIEKARALLETKFDTVEQEDFEEMEEKLRELVKIEITHFA